MLNSLVKIVNNPHLLENFTNTALKCRNKRGNSSWVESLKKKQQMGMDQDECSAVKKEINYHISDLKNTGADITKVNEETYIIQRDLAPTTTCKISNEDKYIKVMEANLDQKDNVLDPMPTFTTVEQRMIDLSTNKLHPMYRRYLNNSKKINTLSLPEKSTYKSRSGPINSDEIPVQLSYNKDLLETKNLYSEYKRVEPPRQLIAKLAEIRQNERPTLQKKVPIDLTDTKEQVKIKSIFDTLYQKEQIF